MRVNGEAGGRLLLLATEEEEACRLLVACSDEPIDLLLLLRFLSCSANIVDGEEEGVDEVPPRMILPGRGGVPLILFVDDGTLRGGWEWDCASAARAANCSANDMSVLYSVYGIVFMCCKCPGIKSLASQKRRLGARRFRTMKMRHSVRISYRR